MVHPPNLREHFKAKKVAYEVKTACFALQKGLFYHSVSNRRSLCNNNVHGVFILPVYSTHTLVPANVSCQTKTRNFF